MSTGDGHFPLSNRDYQPIIGKCKLMCPIKEYNFRKKHNLLHSLEKGEGCHCVKEFHRSAAGETVCHPDNLRPIQVLLETANYLFDEILFHPNSSFVAIYDFIFDRLRSVRQDAVIQELQYTRPQLYIILLEKCINFYCYAAYRKTVDLDLAIDMYINSNHIKNCLETLMDTYCLMSFKFDNPILLKSCLKMLSLYVLQSYVSPETLIEILIKVPKHIRDMQPVKTCVLMCVALRHKNYVKLMKLATLLCHNWIFASLCFLTTNLGEIRSDIIKMLCASHSSKVGSFSALDLRRWLLLQSEKDIISYCKNSGLKILPNNGIQFNKSGSKEVTKYPSGCYVLYTLQTLSKDKIVQHLKGPDMINY
uniref:Germinal-center associated nuclear protein n=1 Tax=Phallusia mammillata TaxID=59560 RepID=A0A6F9DKG8_9ASCI|nr:germinal-center associated nuclear protein [Phallusia mammillata]